MVTRKSGGLIIPDGLELFVKNRFHLGCPEYIDLLVVIEPMKISTTGYNQVEFLC